MQVRHSIRLLEMERLNKRDPLLLINILRAQGMVLMDDGRAVLPSRLTYEDHINGAGTRTFIWDDGIRQNLSTSSVNISGWGDVSGWRYNGHPARVYNGFRDEVGEVKLEEVKVEEFNRTRQVRLND